MSVLPTDLETRLRDQLAAERDVRAADLAALLLESRRIADWRAAEIPDDLRAYLAEKEGEIARAVLAVLADWTRRGGEVLLTSERLAVGRFTGIQSADARAAASGKSVLLGEDAEAETITEQTIPGVVIGALVRDGARAVSPTPPVRAGRPRGSAVIVAPPAASDDAKKLLADRFGKAVQAVVTRAADVPARDWRLELGTVLAAFDHPADDDDAEIGRITRAIVEADRWRAFPKDVQRDLVGLCASRLRRLQDERERNGIDELFSQLSAWSKREHPGFVNGLSRTHRPTRASWSEDAEAFITRLSVPSVDIARPNVERILRDIAAVIPDLDVPDAGIREAVLSQFRRLVRQALDAGASPRDPRLLRLCGPRLSDLDGHEFRALRHHAREDVEADADEADDARPASIPSGWGWWSHTRGKRAILVGGDPREPNRLRLAEAFAFAELEWLPAEGRRNSLQAARDRVRAGKVDLVMILASFVGHDADEVILPACREGNVDWVHIDKGYGIVRVKRAIERFLEPTAV